MVSIYPFSLRWCVPDLTTADTDNFQVDYGREFVDGYKPEGSRLLDAVEKTFK